MVRPTRTALILVAAALVALIASGCSASVKEGSVKVSPSLGSAHVQLETCTYGVEELGGEEPELELCGSVPPELQQTVREEAPDSRIEFLLGFAVPPGTVAPATITAVGKNGSPSYVYNRSAEATTALARAHRQEGDTRPWPPAGSEIVGYASAPLNLFLAEGQWAVDADLGLPSPGGAPFNGNFAVEVADGLQIDLPEEGFEPGRPINCEAEEGSICTVDEGAAIPTSDLKLAPPAAAAAGFPGSKQTLTFPAAFASTATPPPALALSGTSNLAGAVVTPATPTLSGSSASLSVAVPQNAKPGTYSVSLTATSTGGGAVTQAGTLTVQAAKLKFSKLKLNKTKGTGQVSVKLPGAGTLIVSGKGLPKVTKKATKAKTVKVLLKAKGSTAAALATVGKAKLKPKFKFTPSNGAAVSVQRSVVLKLNG